MINKSEFNLVKQRFFKEHINPYIELMKVAENTVDEALAHAEEAEKCLNELRSVWAQGYTSDSVAASSSANALAELWSILGANNQTEAVGILNGWAKICKY